MGRQHPLDVFRSSRDGFDKASKRRTVAGKVIASSVKVKSKLSGSTSGGAGQASASRTASRPKPNAKPNAKSKPGLGAAAASSRVSSAPRPGAGRTGSRVTRLVSAARLFATGPGSKARSGPARKAEGTTRTIFFSAIVMLSAVVLALVFKQFWLGEGLTDMPTMKLEDALPDGPGGPLEPAADVVSPEWFTIRAAVYNSSDRGLELASAAQEELVLRGLPDVTLIGNTSADPAAAARGEFVSLELLVGSARTAQALEGTLDRLLAIDDWAGGKAAPFVDARIVAHPVRGSEDPDS